MREDTLDRLYPKLSKGRICAICGFSPATEMHHIVRRDNLVLRWDYQNLMPLCHRCHTLVTDGKVRADSYIPSTQRSYLAKMKYKNIRDYLLEHALTRDEFLELKRKELNEKITEYSKRA